MLLSHRMVKFSYWAIFVMLMTASEICCQRQPLIPMSVRSRDDPEPLLAPSESTSLKDERCPPSNININHDLLWRIAPSEEGGGQASTERRNYFSSQEKDL